MLRFLFFLALVLNAKSTAAAFIKPCKSGDSACVLQSARAALPVLAAGVPELNVTSLDPLSLPLITSNEGGFKITFIDSTLTGLKGCSVENVKNDMKRKKQSVLGKCDVVLTGNYNTSGQVLILPIQGEGKYKITIKDLLIIVVGDIETVAGADAKQHWHIKNWTDNFQVKTSAHFIFENLFNGNKALGDPLLEFLNTNWKEVMEEIAPPIIHKVAGKVVDVIQNLYKAVPADELYLTSQKNIACFSRERLLNGTLVFIGGKILNKVMLYCMSDIEINHT